MGQAKQRGTFEERRQLVIDEREARIHAAADARIAARLAEDDRIAAMTPAERAAYYTDLGRPRRMSPMAAVILLGAAMGGRYM